MSLRFEWSSEGVLRSVGDQPGIVGLAIGRDCGFGLVIDSQLLGDCKAENLSVEDCLDGCTATGAVLLYAGLVQYWPQALATATAQEALRSQVRAVADLCHSYGALIWLIEEGMAQRVASGAWDEAMFDG
jgi:hypothetical protein